MVSRELSERIGGDAEPVGHMDAVDPGQLAQIRGLAAHYGPCRSVDVPETKDVGRHVPMTLNHHRGLAASPIICDM